MSVLRFLHSSLGWQVLYRSTWKATFWSCACLLSLQKPKPLLYASRDWVWMDGIYEDAFDMRKLINRVELVPWTRSLTIWTPWTLRLRCRQNLFSTCIPCQQNWSMSVNVVASRMNYRERVRSGKDATMLLSPQCIVDSCNLQRCWTWVSTAGGGWKTRLRSVGVFNNRFS